MNQDWERLVSRATMAPPQPRIINEEAEVLRKQRDDLLEAAEAVLRAVRKFVPATPSAQGFWTLAVTTTDPVREIRTAIAKARGER